MTHEVDFRYARRELERIFAYARERDVDKGGRYDGGTAAINIWTHSWTEKTLKAESTVMGTLYVHWADENRIWRVDADKGFSVEDVLKELGVLEVRALGRKVYGR